MLGAIILTSINVTACDVCGGFGGILPNEDKHSISIFYRYRAFKNQYYNGENAWFPDGGILKTAHSPAGNQNTSSYEIFRVAELRGRFLFHKKWDLVTSLPYTMNKEVVGDEQETVSGVGDFSFFVNRYWVNNKVDQRFKYRFSAGFGFKLPTGRNNFLSENGQRIGLYNQAGTGSLDYLIFGNMSLGYKKMGLMISSLMRVNNYNLYNERVAPISSINAMCFRKIKINRDWIIAPSFNGAYENTKGIQIGKNWQSGTSMKLLSCGAGLQVVWKNISFESQLFLPVYEPLGSNSQMSTIRIINGIVINI